MDSQGEQWRIQSDNLPPGQAPANADVPGCAVRLEPHIEGDFEAAAAAVEAMAAEQGRGPRPGNDAP